MSDLVNKIIAISKENPSKTFIYGAGGLAKMISNLLVQNDGGVSAYIVDDEYYSDTCKSIEGIQVSPLSRIEKLENDYYLIIGFEGDYLERLKIPVLIINAFMQQIFSVILQMVEMISKITIIRTNHYFKKQEICLQMR